MDMLQRIRTLLSQGVSRKQASFVQEKAGGHTFQQEAWIRRTLREQKRKTDFLSTPLHRLEYVVIDTETTGFRPEHGDEIISIAAIAVKGKEISTDVFASHVKANRAIPSYVMELTGLSPKEMEQAPPFHTVITELLRIIDQRVIVGYFVGHDMAFLNHYLWKSYRSHLKNRVLEIKQIVDVLCPQLDSRQLDHVLDAFNIPIEKRHTAFGDAWMTARLWSALIEVCLQHDIRDLNELYARLSVHVR
ncbi:MAG: 3'-5' exonuclease [Bacillaceae bacterium]|nr:3'-5' exonuclease [Bacillaceae bacterium]